MAVPLTLSSVPAQTPYVQYVSGTGQTAFPYPFEITQDADLVVLLNGILQAVDGGYSLSGQGTTGGGTVTFSSGLTAGTIVTLYRNIAIARISQLAQNGTFFSSTFNNEFNRIYLVLQQLQTANGFALQVPNTNSGAVTTLTAANYANKYLTFDSNGNPVPGILTNSGTLTASLIGGLLYAQTPAEVTAGITPFAIQYAPGDIRRYGATVGVDCTTFVSAAASCNGSVVFPQGSWLISSTPVIPATVLLQSQQGAVFSGSGAAAVGFTSGALHQEIEFTTQASNPEDFSTLYIRRNANHTGGTVGVVSNAINATTFVGPNVTNFEWALLGVVFNSATAGQNVGGYLQGNRMTSTTGPTWGGTIEVKDQSGQTDPNIGLVGLEVDIRASGTDANQQRVGLDVVTTRLVPGSGTDVASYAGIRVQNSGESTHATLSTGVTIWANCANGFDTSIATIASAAYKMAQGQAISFDAANTSQLSENAGTDIVHSITGVIKNSLLHTGGFAVNSTQVVGSRITGYGTPTGGSLQPSFAAGSITLPNLAAAVAQLISDLKTHGLLGG